MMTIIIMTSSLKLLLVYASLMTLKVVYGEPMVAFVCNRPAMHLSGDGRWLSDEKTNCINDPVDILNYCRQMYTDKDIWNVVEASEPVTINNWCNFAHNNCHHRFTVRPYRCLVGAFQSEPLHVPEHCQFDHIHDSTDCKTFQSWNLTTTQECVARHGAQLYRYSVLQPCAIDGFNGAEFVCCPPASNRQEVQSTAATTSTSTSNSPSKHHHHRVNDDVKSHDVTDKPHRSEHERFVRAKTEMEKRHHERVAKMMTEWAAARRRVQEIKKIDEKGGDKFNREMTARFQKAYESLEHEATMERKRLMSEHQQRVQDELSRKKTESMNDYLEALAQDNPDASRVMTSLLQYVKAEQKDRMHTINHYEHVEETDPVEAEAQRTTVAAHLRGIDERVTQAVDMLSRIPPLFERKIRAQIERYLSSYQSMDESLAVIMAKINDKSNKTPGKLTTMTSSISSTIRPTSVNTGITEPGSMTLMMTSLSSSTTKRSLEVNERTKDPLPITQQRQLYHQAQYDLQQPAHNQKADFNVLESYIEKMPISTEIRGGQLAAPLAIAVCGIAVFILVVAGIAMTRRQTTSRGTDMSVSVTEIDRSVTSQRPQQVNGYENPTYQYYQSSAADDADNATSNNTQ